MHNETEADHTYAKGIKEGKRQSSTPQGPSQDLWGTGMSEHEAVVLIQKFQDAAEANSWKGGGDPRDIPEIEQNFSKAYAELLGALVNGAPC